MSEVDYDTLRAMPMAEIRPHIRTGHYRGQTAGFAPGNLQANLAILGDGYADDEFDHCDLEHPSGTQLHRAVPERIRAAYEEASRIREIAPNAFAVQIRRALEALCEDRGAKGRNLSARIEDLSKKGELPSALVQITDVMRLVGNIGAHGVGESVHPLQVYAIDDFFKVVVEYVYVAPAKLQEFKARFEKSKEVGGDDG